MKRLIMIMAIFAFTACSSKSHDLYSFDKEVYAQGEKAYVVLGALNNASSSYIVYNIFEFKNEKGERIKLVVSGNQSFMIPPGDYKLINFVLYGSNTYGNFRSTIDIQLVKVQGSFTVASGEAVYLGQVNTVITKADKGFFKQLFNIGASESDIDYTSAIADNFNKLDKAKYEAEVGKPLTLKLMHWKKIL